MSRPVEVPRKSTPGGGSSDDSGAVGLGGILAGTSAPHRQRLTHVSTVHTGSHDARSTRTGYRRSHSVVGLGSLKDLVTMGDGVAGMPSQTMTQPIAGQGVLETSVDDASRSRLAQNVWWRSWSIQQRKENSKLKSIPISPFAPESASSDLVAISMATDALSVEGMDKEPSRKRWEEYYRLFLERFATDSSALPFLAKLSSRGSGGRSSLVDQTSSIPSGMGAGEVGRSRDEDDAVGHDLDGSVHGGNLFAAMFKSSVDAGASLPTPSSHEDFSTYTFPWEAPMSALGPRREPVAEAGSSTIGSDVDKPRLDRSRSHPVMMPAKAIPRPIPTDSSDLDLLSTRSVESSEPLLTGTGSSVETILKKAFTGFHNSHKFGQDNVSPYLGDDLSVRGNGIFGAGAMVRGIKVSPHGGASHERADSLDLDWSPSGTSPRTREPLLLPLQDCCAWKRTEQHWLLPAVIAACLSQEVDPDQITGPLAEALSAAPTGSDWSAAEDPELAPPRGMDGSPMGAIPYDPFHTYVLGEVLITSSSLLGHDDFRKLPPRWEPRLLVLRQNYLFEYLPGEVKAPLGFVHLQGSSVSPRLDNRGILHLICLSETTVPAARPTSPSSSGSRGGPVLARHTTLLRARSIAQANRWLALLEAASTVRVEDLYEYVSLKEDAGMLRGAALVKAAELGRGRFAVVRKARRKRREGVEGGRLCALKVVNKAAFWQRVADGKERHDTLVREMLAQALLTAECLNSSSECPIVRLFSAFETRDSIVLELELMSRSDLFDELSTSGVLKEQKTAAIVNQVVKAIAFCHEHGIAHRDVKLSNIIFPYNHSPDTPSSEVQVKLADFGMAGFFRKDGTLRGRCGTPGYVAPEILCAGVNEGYGTNVDSFSVGVVAYTLLCGYEPFYGVTDKQLIAANKQAEYEFHDPEWTRISQEAKDLVSKMLVRDPRRRITPAQALSHPWLKHFNESPIEGGPSGALVSPCAVPGVVAEGGASAPPRGAAVAASALPSPCAVS